MQLEMQELIAAIREQTAAINAMAKSNQQVIALLTDVVAAMVDEDVEMNTSFYLDGEPVNSNGS